MKYEVEMDFGGTCDIYDIKFYDWMTVGEDEYAFKDCKLRIEGSVPTSQEGLCVKNGIECSPYDAYKKFVELMYGEEHYHDYGTLHGNVGTGTIFTGEPYVIWTGTGRGTFTYYLEQ